MQMLKGIALSFVTVLIGLGLIATSVDNFSADSVGSSIACIVLGLIMLFAGVRQEDDGRYAILKNGEKCFVSEDEDILSSFSRLSCDMPPESLSYAVLSDRAIWDEDLREISGLEDLVTEQLRDLQLLGLLNALAKAWKPHE